MPGAITAHVGKLGCCMRLSLMKYSILIPTHNRAAYLKRALQSLADMRKPSDVSLEILVVASACHDDTVKTAKAFESLLPLRVFEVREPGVARARNVGLDAMDGDNIILLDDDVTVPAGFIEAYHDAFTRFADYGFFAGAITARLEGEPAAVIRDVLEIMPSTYSQLWLGDESRLLDKTARELPFGANLGMRRAALGDLRFDETLGRTGGSLNCGEETLLLQNMSGAGLKGLWVPQAHVEHWIHPSRQTMKYVTNYWRQIGMMQVRLGHVTALEAQAAKVAGWRQKLYYWKKRLRKPAAVWIPIFREMMLQDVRRAAFEAGEYARNVPAAAFPVHPVAPKTPVP